MYHFYIMRLRNYLPQLSERFPDLYLVMNDRLLDCIQNAYEEIKEQIGIKEFAKSIGRSTSGLREVIDGKKSPSLGLIAELSRYHPTLFDEVYEHVLAQQLRLVIKPLMPARHG